MYALIMAGGEGSRLSMGEKALVTIAGIPMIRFVIDAFVSAGHDVVVIASSKTPFTMNWCRANEIALVQTAGRGYIEDLCEAILFLDESGAVITSVADIPCLTPAIISEIEVCYRDAGIAALSSWVPEDICRKAGCRTAYTEIVDGTAACPAGINILRGDRLDSPQEETRLLLRHRRLAFNVNTREERELAERHFKKKVW